MNFSIQQEESYVYFKVLNRKLDAELAPDLKSELTYTVGKGEINIMVDLSACEACDSSGMSILTFANRLCREADGQFVVCGLSGRVKEMADMAGLDAVLLTADSKAEAEKLFR